VFRLKNTDFQRTGSVGKRNVQLTFIVSQEQGGLQNKVEF